MTFPEGFFRFPNLNHYILIYRGFWFTFSSLVFFYFNKQAVLLRLSFKRGTFKHHKKIRFKHG